MAAIVVTSGITSTHLTIGDGEQLLVSSGGTATHMTIDSGGYEVVSGGGSAGVTEVQSGGYLVILPNATATGTTPDTGVNVFSTGAITVQPGGAVTTSPTLICHTVTRGGAEYILPDSITSNSVISSGGSVIVFSAGTSFGTTVVSGGMEVGYYGAVASGSLIEAGGSSIVDYGSAVSATVAGVLLTEGGSLFATIVNSGGSELVGGDGTAFNTTVSSGGSETVYFATTRDTTIATSGLLELRSGGIAAGTVTFAGSGGVLQIDSTEAVPAAATIISGFTTGDSIDFAFITSAVGDNLSVAGDIVTISAGAAQYYLTIDGADAGGLQLGATTGGSLDLIAVCYLRGTRILTPTGQVPIESLAIGDPLVTRYQGIQRIIWIGRQSYAARFIKNNREQIPVRIKAGALGDHLPARDLFVSPGHSMLIGDTLVLAKCLVNGVTVTQDDAPEEVHYYQIEFESHDCVIAEGTWSESYADVAGLRGRFHNAAAFATLYPEYRTPETLNLCAPRPVTGPMLDVALRPVVAQASAALRPGALRGSIDALRDHRVIEGWAQDRQNPEMPVLLEILLGGRVIGSMLACDHRADLQAAGFGQGRCAFFFKALVEITPAMAATIQVRRAADGAALAMSAVCAARIAGTRAA